MLTASQYAARRGLSLRRAQTLCQEGRISGANKIGRDWMIPAKAQITAGKRGPKLKGEL